MIVDMFYGCFGSSHEHHTFCLTGAAIIVIMVIAVLIGLLIFVGGLVYLKR